MTIKLSFCSQFLAASRLPFLVFDDEIADGADAADDSQADSDNLQDVRRVTGQIPDG